MAGGLVYRILDENGKPIGVPIKASAFYNKPTLKFLEVKYAQNEVRRQPHKARVKNAVDMALLKDESLSVKALARVLEKDGIIIVLRQNKDGLVYGITYVDHRTKCVSNGNSLGKKHSAKAIQERCQQEISFGQKKTLEEKEHEHISPLATDRHARTFAPSKGAKNVEGIIKIPDLGKALDKLLQPEQPSEFLPYQLKRNKKKKRRKKGVSNNQ